jgi:hypothetical protein
MQELIREVRGKKGASDHAPAWIVLHNLASAGETSLRAKTVPQQKRKAKLRVAARKKLVDFFELCALQARVGETVTPLVLSVPAASAPSDGATLPSRSCANPRCSVADFFPMLFKCRPAGNDPLLLRHPIARQGDHFR